MPTLPCTFKIDANIKHWTPKLPKKFSPVRNLMFLTLEFLVASCRVVWECPPSNPLPIRAPREQILRREHSFLSAFLNQKTLLSGAFAADTRPRVEKGNGAEFLEGKSKRGEERAREINGKERLERARSLEVGEDIRAWDRRTKR